MADFVTSSFCPVLFRLFVFSRGSFRYIVLSRGVILSFRRAMTPGERRNNEMAQTSHHTCTYFGSFQIRFQLVMSSLDDHIRRIFQRMCVYIRDFS